jgi:hypothetical protein
MDMECEVLMGAKMWDKPGGEGTFVELVKVVESSEKRNAGNWRRAPKRQ